MADLHARITDLKDRLEVLRGHLDIPGKKARLSEIEHLAQAPDFWGDNQKAQGVLKEKAGHEARVVEFERGEKALEDAEVLLQLAEEAKDDAEVASAGIALDEVERQVKVMEFNRMLSGPDDRASCFLDINAGAGGTDAMDWASMLLRMYTRYCERKGFKVELSDFVPGEEAGIKNASLFIEGEFAYGFLKAENGVHRLVRISPFDANARRQTAFASVDVHPQIDDSIKIDIPEKDIEVKAIRGGGAGGQKVNKTSSTIQLRYIPKNWVITIQTERSQSRNRDLAFQVLRSRLYEEEQKRRDAERNKAESAKMDIAFGSQIRSYVLHPYQLIKDHRTGVEKGQVNAVLDGDLEEFITAWLLGVRNPNRPQE
ncbi:MAG: peptide chain release factor 2 [Myxococcales bacterium]